MGPAVSQPCGRLYPAHPGAIADLAALPPVDWGQNDRHKSTVAAYSLRAKLSRPTVSLPVTRAELAAAVDAGDAGPLLSRPQEALERVADIGDLFAPVLTLPQRLPG